MRSTTRCATILLLAAPVLAAQGGVSPRARQPEYQVKAQYLGLLGHYVTWPTRSSPGDSGRPLILGILGNSPFDPYLRDSDPGRGSQGHPLSVRYLGGPREAEACDILFLCESESPRLAEILKALRGRPVLTIGDTPNFARRGVMINLIRDQDRVRFEINLGAVRASGLEVSSHILKLAIIID